jgi:uncharacterized OB-fold protein
VPEVTVNTAFPQAALVDAAIALPHVRVARRGGAIAHASHDEDAVTLAALASGELLERNPDRRPRALLTASVTAPLVEGGIAQVLAEVLDLAGPDLLVQEHGGTVASTGGALAGALALITAGMGPVLVVAADTRRDAQGRATGDAAVAFLLDREGDVATLTHRGSGAELIRDHWRMDGSRVTQAADGSFLKSLRDHDEEPLVETTPDGPAIDRVGAAGCAAFPLSLLLALEDGASGIATTRGSGVVHRFEVSAGPAATVTADAARATIAAGADGPAPATPETAGFDPYASQPRSYRERAQDLRLEGQHDPATGEVLFPPVPAASADGLEPRRLGHAGTVLTMTRDHVFPHGAPLSMAVVSLDGGGRFFGQVADGLEVAIGDPVRLVLRRLHDGGGIPHYFWKVAPVATTANHLASA